MQDMQDLYSVLGLPQGSSEQDIKKAYRERALNAHPDRGGDPERMKQLNEAYATLSDPDKRKEFDGAWRIFSESAESQEVDSPVAGALGGSTEHLSDTFRKQHAESMLKYTEQPLQMGSVSAYFQAFHSDLYFSQRQKREGVYHDDIFSWLRRDHIRFPFYHPPFPFQVTPEVAVLLLRDFLRGNNKGDRLNSTLDLLSAEIEKLKKEAPYSSEISLYEGIQGIFLRLEEPDAAPSLLSCMKAITDYAKQTASFTMPFFAPLFQDKRFRHLFSQALHQYWMTDEVTLGATRLDAFDGEEATKMILNGLRLRLARSHLTEEPSGSLKKTIQYLRLLHQFETDLFESDEVGHDAVFYREKAYHIIDWAPALAGMASPPIVVNNFLRAGLYFQYAAMYEEQPAVQMADERMAQQMYLIAISMAHKATPDIEFYACTQMLKCMSLFKYQDPELKEIIQAFQHRALVIADVFPFLHLPQANIDFLMKEDEPIILMRQFLHTLVRAIEANQSSTDKIPVDYEQIRVLYQAYEACLKNWYEERHDPETESKLRLDLMKALLESHRWTFADLSKNLDTPWLMIDRDEEGWMRPTRALPIPEHPDMVKFRALDGVELNYKTGQIAFSFNQWEKGKNPAYDGLLTIFDLSEMLDRNMMGAIFSLDPVDPDMFYHPFNQMRFSPSSIYQTQMLHTMLLTDYLLKFLTVGQEVQGRYPYQMRSLDQLTAQLPMPLKKIIDDFHAAQHEESLHRFWIEAVEVPVAISDEQLQTAGVLRVAASHIKMVVKKHQMKRDMHGELVDKEESDEGWMLYVLTPAQKRELDASGKKLPGYALIFMQDSNQVYFSEEGQLSPVFSLAGYEKQLARLFRQRRESDGKVTLNIQNRELLYRITREVARRAEKPNRFSPEFIFAQEFTSHYDEFAQYFPEFGRLRELSKITALIRVMNSLRESNQEALKKLEEHLNDGAHWQAREAKIQEAVRSLRTKYDSDYREQYGETYRRISAQFAEWQRDFNGQYSKQLEKLRDIERQLSPLKVTSSSSEVEKIAREKLEEIKGDVISRHGYSAWDWKISSEAESEIRNHKSEWARQLTDAKRKALDNAFSSVRSDMGDYTYNRLVEGFINGDGSLLASQLADITISEGKRQIQGLFPGNDIEAALRGDSSALSRIATDTTQKQMSKYKADVEEGVARVGRIVEEEKQELRNHIQGRRRLESSYDQLGVRKRETDVDLTGRCLWVPADVRHDVGGMSSRLVYGGVHVEPRIEMIEPQNPLWAPMIAGAFTQPTQCRVDMSYIVSAKSDATPSIPGAGVGYLTHMRLLQSAYDTLVEARARGKNIEAIKAAAKAKVAAEREASAAAAASGSSGGGQKPPPGGGASSGSSDGSGRGGKPPKDPNARGEEPSDDEPSSGDKGGPSERRPHSPRFFEEKALREAAAARLFDETLRGAQSTEEFDARVQSLGLNEEASKVFDRVAMVKGFQCHHIISHTNEATKDHKLFRLAGFDVQSQTNKIYLPTGEGLHRTRAIHLGRHLKSLSAAMAKKMDDIVDEGKTAGWTQERYREELRDMLSEVRQELRAGNIALNKNMRNWSVRW